MSINNAVDVIGPCERPRVAVGALVSFTWAHETVPSLHARRRGIDVDGACSAEAADYRPYILELFLARGQFTAKRRSLLWVWCNGDWRNKSAIERYVDPAGPFAQTRFLGKWLMRSCQPSREGKRPCSLAIGTGCDLACDEVGLLLSVHNVLHDSYLAFLVSCGVKRARLFVPASGPSAAAALPDCPALQRQQGGCNGEDEDGDGDDDGEAARTRSLCKVTLDAGLTETAWHTMNK